MIVYLYIHNMSVPRTRKYRKRQNQFMSNHLIDVQQIKNVYNTQKKLIKLGLLNIRSLSTKALFVNEKKAKGEVLLQFITIFSVFLRRQALSITPLK